MNENVKENDRFTFEILEHVCVLGKPRDDGFSKEFNLVSFMGKPAKWDIREWNHDHTRMKKGMTLTDEEMKMIISSVGDRFENEIREDAAAQDNK